MNIELITTIFSKEIYLFGLIAAFVIGGILRNDGYFAQLFLFVSSIFRNKKAVLAIISTIGGILPVEGRASISAPFLDSIIDGKHSSRSKMGIVDYISTHHYYLWSPIEPAVVIFITALGISWGMFLQATLIPLIAYIGFFIAMLLTYVKEEEINFHYPVSPIKDYDHTGKTFLPIVLTIITALGLMIYQPEIFAFWYTFPVVAIIIALLSKTTLKEAFKFISWKTVGVVAIIIAAGVCLQTLNSSFIEILKSQELTLPLLLCVGMLAAFVMGSSSKYAGLGAAIVTVTGPALLPLIVIVEFVGYLLSPIHKCLGISKMYFNTDILEVYKFLVPLAIILLMVAYVTYFVFYT